MGEEVLPSQRMEVVESEYQWLMRHHSCPVIPFLCSLVRRPSCHTVSKASRNATNAFFFCSRMLQIASWRIDDECVQLRPGLNPPCKGLS